MLFSERQKYKVLFAKKIFSHNSLYPSIRVFPFSNSIKGGEEEEEDAAVLLLCHLHTVCHILLLEREAAGQIGQMRKQEADKRDLAKMISRDSFASPKCAHNTYVDVVLFDLSEKLFRHFL